MIVGVECAIRRQLTGKQARGQRDAGEDANTLLASLFKEEVGGPVPEEIEDDLDALQVGVLEGLERLFHLFDADTVVADLPGGYKIVENAKGLGHVVDLGRGTVELDQVECVGFEIGETALDKRGEIVPVVSLGDVGVEIAAHFGRDVDLFAKVATESRQQTLAAAVAIAVCRVEEVDPKLRGPVQGRERLGVVNRSPGATDSPTSEADCGYVPPGSSQLAILHQLFPPRDQLMSCAEFIRRQRTTGPSRAEMSHLR